MAAEELFLSAIANVGFPIAMSIYILTRFETILKENTKTLKQLQIEIIKKFK